MAETKRQTEAQKAGHTHAEAFCRMKYRDDVTGEFELIWNSRDGVTPFAVVSKAGNPSTHVEFYNDSYLPHFVPPIGSRIFVDLTEEKARQYAEEFVDRYWDHGEYPMSDHYDSREDAVQSKVNNFLEPDGRPDLIEVTREVLEQHFGFEIQTCPRRTGEAGPWHRDNDLDVWYPKPNGQRCCSFCGGIHPDDFEAFLKRAADPEDGARIDLSDKRHKVYLHDPDVRNASEGALKCYRYHLPEDETGELNELFRKAHQASQTKFSQYLAEQRLRMQNRQN